MKITANTKIEELLKNFPFLEDFISSYNPKFSMLKNPMAKATIGKVATLKAAAGVAGLDIEIFLSDIANQIKKQTGKDFQVDFNEADLTREERMQILKEIITKLHDEGNLDEAQKRFSQVIKDIDASEIAAMEEELIRNGLPVSEVQRLCDVHVGAFKNALDKKTDLEVPLGHPVSTYLEDNKIITKLANELSSLASNLNSRHENEYLSEAQHVLKKLYGMENHYQRKENQLFSILERHGITGPTQVMWGVHNQIRTQQKEIIKTIESKDFDSFKQKVPGFVRDIIEMIYKEEKILFPLSMQTLTEQEWVEIKRGEDDLGYKLSQPAAKWPEKEFSEPKTSNNNNLQNLMTGELSIEQLNLLLSCLPVDLSFVDETDTVKFYSEGQERIFPRSPAVIGRKVQNCHPPKSVHVVEDILLSFKEGRQDTAEFWIQMQEKFIHIRYFAIRDKNKNYKGCLEVSQDVTDIRKLEGERRLLEWKS